MKLGQSERLTQSTVKHIECLISCRPKAVGIITGAVGWPRDKVLAKERLAQFSQWYGVINEQHLQSLSSVYYGDANLILQVLAQGTKAPTSVISGHS